MSNRFPRRVTAALLAMCLFVVSPSLIRGEDKPPSDAAGQPPEYEQFIVIPLRIHVLTASDLPEVDCKLSDDDVRRIVGKVNGVIWHKAGIHFGLESIRRAPAERQDEFRKWRDRLGGNAPLDLYPMLRRGPQGGGPGDAKADGGVAGHPPDPATTGAAAEETPDAGAAFEGLHVYYVHELPTNGVYFGEGFAFVKETAELRPVPGGIDEPIPRVTAHELGHALGLPHRQNWTNLMASGTTGTLLTAAEVAAARQAAGKLAGAAGVAAVRGRAAAAEQAGDAALARQLWGWLADVPGTGAADAARHRDAIRPEK